MDFKILDCTLRDGGYYTNWDFDDELVNEYCEAMQDLPVDYIEVGYRSIPLDGYLGQYFYCPEYVLKKLKTLMPEKELTIILNEKDIRVSHIEEGLLTSAKPYVSMVRMAIDPKNMERAVSLAKAVKKEGFKVAFNVMYMSDWKTDSSFLDYLEGLDEVIDYFYMVDSYGGVFPEDLKDIVALVKAKTSVPIGFHGHNNLEMALINSITAISLGCTIIDATITGMGRGAGNLKMELFLTYLETTYNISLNYRALSKVVAGFEELQQSYHWGTSLPYMFSGAKSLPQKQVMEWVGMNRYPMANILNALHNQNQKVSDNLKLPVLQPANKYTVAVVLGGGASVKKHKLGISKFFEKMGNKACLIHAGARNVLTYLDVEADQYYGLVGFESEKLVKQIGDFSKLTEVCVYPPYPRPMGTTIPKAIEPFAVELQAITFTKSTSDSPMAIAIQTAVDLGATEIYLLGFDGYDVNINHNQFVIAQENQKVIDDAVRIPGVAIHTFTPTKYSNLEIKSLYSLL